MSLSGFVHIKLLLCFNLQLFWERKLSGLNAFDIAEELVKTMDLPKGLQGEITKANMTLCGYKLGFF